MSTEKKLTGYPSIDKPWLAHYPEFVFTQRKSYKSIYENLSAVWTDESKTIINYYDTNIRTKDFFERVEQIKKSLYSVGVREGDSIAVALESVPEFLELFLACEQLGCSVKNYLASVADGLELICECTATIYIAHDYISQSDVDLIYNNTDIDRIILIDPLFSATNKEGVRANIRVNIKERYTDALSNDERNILWEDFLKLGEGITDVPNPTKNNILLSAFTSGTSGKPKEVLHTSETLMGVINQLSLFPSHEKGKDTWLLTILPPTLVAVVVAMIFYPLADGKQLILDPFCKIEDLDLEMMHYKPNCWGLIPIFFNTLLESDRIPDDYDMSYFKLFGFGAEPMTKKFISKVQDFLDRHNCQAPFSSGYGQSEGGSDFTVCIGREMISSGGAGIPLIDTTIAIFAPGTTTELEYGQIGEVCKLGPGIMVGYADDEKTKEALKIHSDGNVWLHTGDYGFITSQGMLFVLGRNVIDVYPDKKVFALNIENKVALVDGVQEAIVVSGTDFDNKGFEVLYLFIVPEKDFDREIVMANINSFVEQSLLKEECPKEIYFIDEKPISKFKTDRKTLQNKYKLV